MSQSQNTHMSDPPMSHLFYLDYPSKHITGLVMTGRTAQHHRYPVQPEQDRNAVPNQSSSSVPRRWDGEAVDVYNSFDVRRAVSPENASVSARLASFVDWPARGLPSPRLLVIAGFYYLGT